MSDLTEVTSNKSFGGFQKVFNHKSKELECQMNFAIYIPPQANAGKVPVLYWLSGLTCTEANFTAKAGCQRIASEHGIIIVAPDTSPRNCNIDGEDDDWDFGTGAGFYVDATEEKWKKHYRMYSYITKELPALVNANFPVLEGQISIFGHSMGGHGALIAFIKNPGLYKSASAFGPICNPMNCPWGQKAFSGYLGSNKDSWKEYDATELMKTYKGPKPEILIDQGLGDNFYDAKQLLPENFKKVCEEVNYPLNLRMHEEYDHNYYFISTFLEDHVKHHAKYFER
ncbi:S-formylglutathione hydrolase-like [Dendronephthya gigantea]|uniref:S-formylglutathione hydrolase-like n=1 Tax=Dendronephthya gigantea TaxID=151771 RepID=UPI00106A7350|nr:S-formylglutathione hydrolase-like [Dendronephthya gigantea]XP_028405448.1 S-formylglutathione hydrolase-like [Dendronephthya gigantea]